MDGPGHCPSSRWRLPPGNVVGCGDPVGQHRFACSPCRRADSRRSSQDRVATFVGDDLQAGAGEQVRQAPPHHEVVASGLVEPQVFLVQIGESRIGVEQSDRRPIHVNQVHAAAPTYQPCQAIHDVLLVSSVVREDMAPHHDIDRLWRYRRVHRRPLAKLEVVDAGLLKHPVGARQSYRVWLDAEITRPVGPTTWAMRTATAAGPHPTSATTAPGDDPGSFPQVGFAGLGPLGHHRVATDLRLTDGQRVIRHRDSFRPLRPST